MNSKPRAGLDRRRVLALGGAALAAPLLPGAPRAEDGAAPGGERHGLSIFGDLKYPPDFAHFDYANPKAPKGGMLSHVGSSYAYNQNLQTFNSLNTFILKGDAAQGLELTFASLMVRSGDEPDSIYGYVARSVRVSEDGRLYEFRLRPEARFHDGSPLTAEDVAFSVNILKEKGHPIISQALRELDGAEAPSPDTVLLRFNGQQARDVPLYAATLPIFSKAYYTTRAFDETTLEAPLGSGIYRVGRFETGRWIEYTRIPDHWARDLPVHLGQWNFDVIRYEFFRDRDVAFEAFKGGAYLLREEFTSKTWATGYDFPAAKDGRVQRLVLPDETPSGAQGWFINTRRDKFKDPRVREALILAFDFEWTNKNLFYGLYERTWSFFQHSDMMAEGGPSPAELALLEPLRGRIPDEVFGEPFRPPVSDGSGQDRHLLRRAMHLLAQAGWTMRDGQSRNARGEPFEIEFLDAESTFDRITLPYIRNLKLLGIEGRIRTVDPAQYQMRVNGFDFDVTTRRYSMSLTPGDDLKRMFGSADADRPGSRNLSGLKDPAVDALIDRAVAAESRAELTTACRALDRVIRAGRYWVPHWYKPSHWLAYWDAFGRPETKPRYARGVLETWWSDPERARRSAQSPG
jgi:microcin C transport system substrate-binding protein